jgi:signal transduction histidine kinase
LKKTLLVCFLFLFSNTILKAQKVVILNDKYKTYNLNEFTFLGDNVPTLQSLANIPPDSLFVANGANSMVYYGAYKPKAWCKFSLDNHTTLQYYVLTIEQSRADTVCLFELMPDGSLVNLGLVTRATALNKRQIIDRNYVYNLDVSPGREHHYYIYSARKYANHGLILSLTAQRGYAKQVSKTALLYGFIIGVLLFVAFVAFCFFLFSKNKVPLYYSIYCTVATLLILADSGFINAYIQLDFWQVNLNIITIIIFYFAIASHIKFTLVLLDMRTNYPKWFYWIGQTTFLLFIFCGIVLAIFTNETILWHLCNASYYIVFFADLFILASIIYSVVKKQQLAYFYFLAYMGNLVIITILMLSNLNYFSLVNPNFDYMYLGPILEITILSLGLSFYFSQKLKREYSMNISLNKAQNQLLTLQEDERRRIAQDLHDDVGNTLAAIKLGLSSNTQEETDTKLQQVIKDLRNITHDLMPANFQNLSLPENVQKLFSELNQKSSIVFSTKSSGIDYKKNEIKELAIFRIIKELVNNSLKHSDAKQIHLQLHFTEEGLILSYEDDGAPYLLQKNSGGIGITNIENRVLFLDGGFTKVAQPKGNLMQFQFPLA